MSVFMSMLPLMLMRHKMMLKMLIELMLTARLHTAGVNLKDMLGPRQDYVPD